MFFGWFLFFCTTPDSVQGLLTRIPYSNIIPGGLVGLYDASALPIELSLQP